MEQKTPHIAIVPTPGMGHLIPLVEFAKRLLFHHHFSLTFIIPANGPPSKSQLSFLEALPSGINYVFLPPINLADLPSNVKIVPQIVLTLTRSLPYVRNALKTLVATKCLVALMVDHFATDAIHVANEFNVSSYVFFPSSAMCLSFFLHLPKFDETMSCEFSDLSEPVQIPGCIPIHWKDLLDSVQDKRNDAYKMLLLIAKSYKLAEGIMVNSFKEMEEGAIKALLEEEASEPPIYPIGPVIQTSSSSEVDGSECLNWLDDQPPGSVVFVSFGSGGTLSSYQLNELAFGLEMSEQRFLWVVRRPNDKVANASFFNSHTDIDPFDFLPKGFVDTTKGRGMVVPSWAPQAQILSHGSTGGFLTHCGWNSILDSVVNGVPLIAWPLFADQKMNAIMLTEGLKVALRPKVDENGIVGRKEIAKVVKLLMKGEEGKRLRNQIVDLKDSARRVMGEDGSSTKLLVELACKWRIKINST